MDRVKERIRGFTLIELIVVIAVIGILATITVVGFGRYQGDTRDARRASSASVIVEALEKYYDLNGEYPSCSAISASAATVTSTTLPGVNPGTLIAPQAPSGQDNSIKCTSAGNILTTNGVDFFEYTGDGSPECANNGSCLKYTLKYKDESDGQILSVDSRRNTSIATSGDIDDLAAVSNGFSTINLTWQSIANASSYTVEQSNDAGFTTGVIDTSSSTNSALASGLTPGTMYFFRVKPVGAAGTANWSNSASTTTRSLATPVIAATANSNSQITVSWPDIQYETSYTLQYSTTGANWTTPTPTTVSGIAAGSTSAVVTGLSTGVQYFFRLQATAPGDTSDWSANASATTIIPAPVCSTSTVNSNTQVTVSWGASTGAATYSLDYATNSGFASPTSITGIATTSRAVSGLNNGTTYYFRVKAVNGPTQSTWGACPSAATGVDGPISVGWSADAYGVRNSASVAWMPGAYPGGGTWWSNGMNIYGTCKPGATVVVRLYAYYAYSNNTSQNSAYLQDWTWNNQDLYVVGGRNTWWVWWQGWVACQVGGTRAGDTYLGNAGPY